MRKSADPDYCEIFRASSIWCSKYLWKLKTMLAIRMVVPISSESAMAPMVNQRVWPGAAFRAR